MFFSRNLLRLGDGRITSGAFNSENNTATLLSRRGGQIYRMTHNLTNRRTSRPLLLSFADDADIAEARLVERVGNDLVVSTLN
ncbi:MAG: hypothetical protein FWC11_01050 [Firmicutes bacterium]|nr:hypothetical protein [Bacillota bacterium]